jgi:hypothetical protein
MPTIWKYGLSLDDEQIINMPAHAKILHVGVQGDSIQMWAMVDPVETNIQHRKIVIVGTGHQMPYADFERVYLGTIIVEMFVWHIFEIHDGGNYPKIYKKVEQGTFVEVNV